MKFDYSVFKNAKGDDPEQRNSWACAVFGHRFIIRGLTGRYVWCSRCRRREDAALHPKKTA